MTWIVNIVLAVIGWITGRKANRDEEFGTVKAENQQLRDDQAVIKKTEEADKQATKDGAYNDADDLDSVRGPRP